MPCQNFKTVIQAERLKPIFNLPEDFWDQDVEVIIKPVSPKKSFPSTLVIKIDTTQFHFNRDEANER